MNLPSSPHDITDRLNQNLANLEKAFCDDRSGASCRIAVDYMIVAGNLLVHEPHPLLTRSAKRRRTSESAAGPPCQQPQPLHILREPELQMTIPDAHLNPVEVTAHAD